MKQQEFEKVVQFYNEVIMQQIIKPLEINEIYSIIHPEVENPQGIAYKLKQRAISVFVGTRKEMVMKSFEDFLKTIDKTDSNEPLDNPSIRVDNPSHEEDFDELQKEFSEFDDTKLQEDEMSPLELLEASYELAQDANEKRSIKMRINKLKKQL